MTPPPKAWHTCKCGKQGACVECQEDIDTAPAEEIEEFIKHLLRLQKSENTYCYLQFPKAIGIIRTLESENKELKAKNEVMREALAHIYTITDWHPSGGMVHSCMGIAGDALDKISPTPSTDE